MKTMRKLALAAMTVVLLPACTAGLQRPEVELESVTLGSVGLRGGTLMANVRVQNPNRFTLRAEDLTYQLYLRDPSPEPGDSAWVRFADGRYDERLELRAGETRTFQVPIEFSFSDLGGAASQILRTGRLDYRATGSVRARTPFGSREVPFRKTGTFMVTGGR